MSSFGEVTSERAMVRRRFSPPLRVMARFSETWSMPNYSIID
jgi:hypothetical protein